MVIFFNVLGNIFLLLNIDKPETMLYNYSCNKISLLKGECDL